MKLSLVLVMSLFSLLGLTAAAAPLEVGATAPVLTAKDQDGKPVDFGKVYAGGLALIYFYPKASTPGCTAQACSLRDQIVQLKNLGITVIGVSHDGPAAQKKFKEKNQLPFTLVADDDGQVVKAFGVPTIMFGIPKRQSFLVKNGKIVWRSLSAQTSTHADEVRKAVAELK